MSKKTLKRQLEFKIRETFTITAAARLEGIVKKHGYKSLRDFIKKGIKYLLRVEIEKSG